MQRSTSLPDTVIPTTYPQERVLNAVIFLDEVLLLQAGCNVLIHVVQDSC